MSKQTMGALQCGILQKCHALTYFIHTECNFRSCYGTYCKAPIMLDKTFSTTSLPNVLKLSLEVIAVLTLLAVYILGLDKRFDIYLV